LAGGVSLSVGVLLQLAEALEQAHHAVRHGAREGVHLLVGGRRERQEGGALVRPRWGSREQSLWHEDVEVEVGLERGAEFDAVLPASSSPRPAAPGPASSEEDALSVALGEERVVLASGMVIEGFESP
jgi:hypothetical protein